MRMASQQCKRKGWSADEVADLLRREALGERSCDIACAINRSAKSVRGKLAAIRRKQDTAHLPKPEPRPTLSFGQLLKAQARGEIFQSIQSTETS